MYPTDRPTVSPSSSAIRWATVTAATRLGWVQPMMPRMPLPASRHILGIWVVFPEPVSPVITMIWCRWIARMISSLLAAIGRDAG